MHRSCIIIFRRELHDEIVEVSSRRKLMKYFEQSALEKILGNIDEFAEFHQVSSEIKFLNDSKDDNLFSVSTYEIKSMIKLYMYGFKLRFS